MSEVTQAMLLAAGLSTRLRPLTDKVPKPLLPFWDRSLLDFTLEYLRRFGIQDVAMNVHHGRNRLLHEMASRSEGPTLTPFVEDVLLGTGGGIKNMRPFITTDTFVVINCDFFTDVDLAAAIAFHREKKSLGTMVLIPTPEEKKYGAIGVDKNGKLVEFPYGDCPGGAVRQGMFSGLHILSRDLFAEMPSQEIFCINREVYAPLVERGAPVFGYVTKARWLDVGETQLYAETQFSLLNQPLRWLRPTLKDYEKKASGIYVHKTAQVARGVRLKGPALIGPQVRVESGSTIGPRAIIGPFSTIGKKGHVSNAVLYPSSLVDASVRVENVILTDAKQSVEITPLSLRALRRPRSVVRARRGSKLGRRR